MPHFLLSALGSAGDVHPFIAVARALKARGHSVQMIASPHFEERIRVAGIPFTPLGAPGDYEKLLERPELWQARGGARFILDKLLQRLPESYAVTAASAERPHTVLVGSTLSWGTRLVQEVTGLRAATLHLSPLCMPSAIEPPILPGVGDLGWLPAWAVRSLRWAAERGVVDRWIGPRLNAFRGTLGLPPVQRIWTRWIHSPDLVLGAWPAWFAAPRRDWPPHAATSGFPIFDEGGSSLNPGLTAFLEDGAPPIGITPGSAMAHGERFFARAIEACRALGCRVVLITAYRDQLPKELPDWARHVAYAPFSALIPRLSALIHHGGIGTSAQALAAGIPQGVVPFAHDQFDNAARLRRLGVSRTLDLSMSVEGWVATIGRLVDDAATRTAVRHQADRMAADPPAAEVIAGQLEGLAMRRQDPA